MDPFKNWKVKGWLPIATGQDGECQETLWRKGRIRTHQIEPLLILQTLYSFRPSFTLSFIPSLSHIQSFIHACIRAFTHSFIRSFANSLDLSTRMQHSVMYMCNNTHHFSIVTCCNHTMTLHSSQETHANREMTLNPTFPHKSATFSIKRGDSFTNAKLLSSLETRISLRQIHPCTQHCFVKAPKA